MQEHSFIFKKFFTYDMYKYILDYNNTYSKICPFYKSLNVFYKKDLNFFNHIHYQINSFFENTLQKKIKPTNNYLLKPFNSQDIAESSVYNIGDFCFFYVINCKTNQLKVEDKFYLNKNEGYLNIVESKINLNDDFTDISLVAFYFDQY